MCVRMQHTRIRMEGGWLLARWGAWPAKRPHAFQNIRDSACREACRGETGLALHPRLASHELIPDPRAAPGLSPPTGKNCWR